MKDLGDLHEPRRGRTDELCNMSDPTATIVDIQQAKMPSLSHPSDSEWQRDIFSDEIGFSLDGDDQQGTVVSTKMKGLLSHVQRAWCHGVGDLKQELEEEGSRCLLLVKQHRFNEQCCIRCCQPFSFLLNPRRACLDCTYNVCKACCSYSQQERGYICTACHKTRSVPARNTLAAALRAHVTCHTHAPAAERGRLFH
ncbi:hypothetical protein AOLI_G00258730 [Acnodon oligacanthus]